MQAYADALLIIPKVLAQNSGMDQQETIVKLQEEYRSAGQPVGLDISTGKLYFNRLTFPCRLYVRLKPVSRIRSRPRTFQRAIDGVHVTPKSPKAGSKSDFKKIKFNFIQTKSATKFFCVKTSSGTVVV